VKHALSQRGLSAEVMSQPMLTEHHGRAWLILPLDLSKVNRIEQYANSDVLHHLATVLKGKRVLLSNSTGLRYTVLLSDAPTLPAEVEYPGHRKELCQLGVTLSGTVMVKWRDLGHVLIGGMTGFGKSNVLRLIVEQAIADNFQLLLADPDGRTFAAYSGHPALLEALGETLDGCALTLKCAEGEINRRASLYRHASHNPDDIDSYNAHANEPLRRLLVVVDEFNGLVQASGGVRGAVAQAATQIAWRGRKFGVTLILAGQTFEKESVGPVRDQMATRICFRVAAPSISRIVVGRAGAERLLVKGRALSTFGVMQTYLAPKSRNAPSGDGLTKEERILALKICTDHNGRMTLTVLEQLGYPKRQAARLRDDWENRGLAMKRPEQDNALCLTPEIMQAVVQAGLTV